MRRYEKYLEWGKANPTQIPETIHQLFSLVEDLEKLEKEGKIYFDEEDGSKKLRVIKRFIIDAKGTTLQITDWQEFLVSNAFGWKYKDTGFYVVMEMFLFIAKKSGKSTFVAALATEHMLSTVGASVVLVGVDYTQSKICFEAVRDIINYTPELAEMLYNGEIFVRESGNLIIGIRKLGGIAGTIKMFPASRKKAAQGQNPTFIIFDEISSYAKNDGDIIDKIKSGQTKPNSITWYLTTAEKNLYNRGKNEYDKAKHVLKKDSGFETINYFPLIYELDENDEVEEYDKWIKANPSMGQIETCNKQLLIAGYISAKQAVLPLPAFIAYRLNRWISESLNGISQKDWMVNVDNYETYKEYLTDEKLKMYPCIGAVDLSKKDDYTAYTLMWYIADINKFYCRHKFYIPLGQVEEKMRTEVEQVKVWIEEGFITATNEWEIPDRVDKVINYRVLEDQIVKDFETYKFDLALDPSLGKEFISNLNKKCPYLVTIPIIQKEKMQFAYPKFYAAALAGRFIDNNPVMQWHVACCEFYPPRENGGLMVKKIDPRSSSMRKDGVTTAAMCIFLLGTQADKIVEMNNYIKNMSSLKF